MAGIFSASAADIDKAKWSDGKALFKSNCAACHNPKADGTGPALMGVTARWEAAGDFKGKTGKQWLYTWITNWTDAVSGGYKYAVDMRASRPAQMNVFAGILKPEDIDKILLYVENPDAGGPAVAAGPVGGTGATRGGRGDPAGQRSTPGQDTQRRPRLRLAAGAAHLTLGDHGNHAATIAGPLCATRQPVPTSPRPNRRSTLLQLGFAHSTTRTRPE